GSPPSTAYPTPPPAPPIGYAGATSAPPAAYAAGAPAAPPSAYATSATPGAPVPGATTTATPPWGPPPAPARPVVRGPGAGAFGAVLGGGLLITAVVLLLDINDPLPAPPVLVAFGVWMVLLGLAIAIAGALGRSSGSLGFLAVVGVVLALPLSLMAQGGGGWRSWWGDGRFVVISDTTWEPTRVEDAQAGLRVGAGDVDIDLTRLPLDGTDVIDVPVSVGAGDVDLVLPDGVPAEVFVRMAA